MNILTKATSKEKTNMVGHFELDFFMEDSSEEEMNDIFDEIAEEITQILFDYEIVSVNDFQMTQESQRVKNRLFALMDVEESDTSKTFKESVSELSNVAKQFLLGHGLRKFKS